MMSNLLIVDPVTLNKKHSSKVDTRILCLDPAISKCGWSIIDYKNGSFPPINVVRWGNISAGSESKKVAYKDQAEKYGNRILSLVILRRELIKLVEEFCPEHIAVEDAFFSRLYPSAFAALEQVITTIMLMAKDIFCLPVYRIPTKCAKKAVAKCTGSSDKNDVLSGILSSELIGFRQKKLANKLDHHSADSIAVGIHFLSEVYPTLNSIKEVSHE